MRQTLLASTVLLVALASSAEADVFCGPGKKLGAENDCAGCSWLCLPDTTKQSTPAQPSAPRNVIERLAFAVQPTDGLSAVAADPNNLAADSRAANREGLSAFGRYNFLGAALSFQEAADLAARAGNDRERLINERNVALMRALSDINRALMATKRKRTTFAELYFKSAMVHIENQRKLMLELQKIGGDPSASVAAADPKAGQQPVSGGRAPAASPTPRSPPAAGQPSTGSAGPADPYPDVTAILGDLFNGALTAPVGAPARTVVAAPAPRLAPTQPLPVAPRQRPSDITGLNGGGSPLPDPAPVGSAPVPVRAPAAPPPRQPAQQQPATGATPPPSTARPPAAQPPSQVVIVTPPAPQPPPLPMLGGGDPVTLPDPDPNPIAGAPDPYPDPDPDVGGGGRMASNPDPGYDPDPVSSGGATATNPDPAVDPDPSISVSRLGGQAGAGADPAPFNPTPDPLAHGADPDPDPYQSAPAQQQPQQTPAPVASADPDPDPDPDPGYVDPDIVDAGGGRTGGAGSGGGVPVAGGGGGPTYGRGAADPDPGADPSGGDPDGLGGVSMDPAPTARTGLSDDVRRKVLRLR